MIQSGVFGTALPVTASHEGAGTVVAAGSSAALKPGDRVMCGLPFHPCGKCPDCTGPNEGWRQYCDKVEGHCGVHRDGFFAEYAVCDARTSTKLPDDISLLSAAPLACAGRTVWRGIEQAGLREGQWLAIVGSGGGLGHLGLQFAKRKGLKVIGIDARDEGLQISKDLGADIVIDARKGQDAVVKEVQEVTRNANPGNPGVDATVTLSDASTAAALGCAITKKHATMVQIAQPKDVVVPFQELVFRDIKIIGSVISSPEESNAMVSTVDSSCLSLGVGTLFSQIYRFASLHTMGLKSKQTSFTPWTKSRSCSAWSTMGRYKVKRSLSLIRSRSIRNNSSELNISTTNGC